MNDFFSTWQGRDPAWLSGDGPEADLVLGTAAVLARNVAGFTFPEQAEQAALDSLLKEIRSWAEGNSSLQEWDFLTLADLHDSQRALLQEKQLAHLKSPPRLAGQGLLVAPAGDGGIQINAEDHLRLVALKPGFDPGGAVQALAMTEATLEVDFAFAYQEQLGYLTAWPGRVGTGLQLSALVHLPGLVLADEIDKILNALHQLRFAVRGLFGRGSAVRGCLFQITSLVTLGRDEEEITSDFSYHLGKVLGHEKSAREQLYARDRLWLEDLILRSHAVLQAARLITTQESFDRLSHLRLGVSLGILPRLEVARLNRMVMGQQPAHLQNDAGQSLTGNDRAAARAAFLRRELSLPGFGG